MVSAPLHHQAALIARPASAPPERSARRDAVPPTASQVWLLVRDAAQHVVQQL